MPHHCLSPILGSSLWLASVALMVQLAESSAGNYRRPVPGGKAHGFTERTLILLDVNTRSPIKTLNANFLSLQLDPSVIHDGWLDFLSSKRLVTLARGLAPAYLRFGGKRTDFLYFHNLKNLAKHRGGPGPDYYLKNYEDGKACGANWLMTADIYRSKRLVTLARGLAPAYLRFGGKRTDFLYFHNLKNLAKHRGGPGPDYYLKNYEDDIVRSDIALDKQKGCKLASHPDIMLELQREKAAQMQLVLLKEQFSNMYSNITITARSLDKLYNFADCAGLRLIFGLNALHRNPDNSWNGSSALSLLKYSASKKYNISWELGNEPNSYRAMVGRTVNGSQLARDYLQLRNLLQSVRFYNNRASLYGPNIGRPRKTAILLLDGYYIDGRVAKVADFMKTRLLDTLTEQISKVLKAVKTHAPGKKVWLGGVGPAWAGGINNLSDTYAASFLWLNTLGMSAMQGIDVVIRHSFFDYGYNHLVDQNFNPLPDYWLSLLFKHLVGPRVLAVHVAGLQRKPRPGRVIRDKLRIYAHCTSFQNHNYVRGSITLYIINLHRSRKKIKLAGTLRDKTVHQYLLQPYGIEGLQAKSVQLNGEPLKMLDDETFPELKPKRLHSGRTIVMPPMTIGFYVVKNVNAYACRYR
ncbi:Inactive heparanase-2 [Acipenser ruthenus]|uniref:Inactive heparanase-2 n=1 Tax=Acipenser ruthenus TaxID=7906 RepID=A0A444ULE5_ACIRT|nr:Inactive heparanase-2 [Acipenser ruthenus]